MCVEWEHTEILPRRTLLKFRTASSLALAAGVVLGMSGCNLIAPQATTVQYAPSDGIEVQLEGIDVLNALLVADEGGQSFNFVFNTVNLTGSPADLGVQFTTTDGKTASADVKIPAGNTNFGHPDKGQEIVVVDLPGVRAGDTVDASFQLSGQPEEQSPVPVLDGTLAEYAPLVLPADAKTEMPKTDDLADEPVTE